MTTPSEPTAPVTRNPDMDQLHWLLQRMVHAQYGIATVILRDKLGTTSPLLVDALLALDEATGRAVQYLDTFIPGGCPDGDR